jgi:hypothetical protein
MTRLDKEEYIATTILEWGPFSPSVDLGIENPLLRNDDDNVVINTINGHTFTYDLKEPYEGELNGEFDINNLSNEGVDRIYDLTQQWLYFNLSSNGLLSGEMIDDDYELTDEELQQIIDDIMGFDKKSETEA